MEEKGEEEVPSLPPSPLPEVGDLLEPPVVRVTFRRPPPVRTRPLFPEYLERQQFNPYDLYQENPEGDFVCHEKLDLPRVKHERSPVYIGLAEDFDEPVESTRREFTEDPKSYRHLIGIETFIDPVIHLKRGKAALKYQRHYGTDALMIRRLSKCKNMVPMQPIFPKI